MNILGEIYEILMSGYLILLVSGGLIVLGVVVCRSERIKTYLKQPVVLHPKDRIEGYYSYDVPTWVIIAFAVCLLIGFVCGSIFLI